jgi:hypothetical protein
LVLRLDYHKPTMAAVIEIDDDDSVGGGGGKAEPPIDWSKIYIPTAWHPDHFRDFVTLLKRRLPWEEMELPNPHSNPHECVDELRRRQSINPYTRQAGDRHDPLLDGVPAEEEQHPPIEPTPRVLVDERFSDEQRPVNVEFEIDLEPMAWKRPKPFVKKAVCNGKFYTKNVANVNKQNTQRFQDLVIQQYEAKYGPLAGPHFVDNVVVVDMCFARKRL